MIKRFFAIIFAISACYVNAQTVSDGNWGLPNPDKNWGASDPNTSRKGSAGQRSESSPAKGIGKAIPDTPVANPFDASGVYMGETQTLSNTGIDPASGITVPDAPTIDKE